MKQFLLSDEVVALREDRELFNYFFKELSNPDVAWTTYFNEPKRKVAYKYEDGMKLVSCMAECEINSPLINVLALFGEIDLFKDWFPNVTACDIINKVSNYKGLYRCQ